MRLITVTRLHKRRITLVITLLSALAIAMSLILFAMRENINLFYSPSTIGEAGVAKEVKLGGMVVKGSIIYKDDMVVNFKLTDYDKAIVVAYKGILPDLFREGQGVVTQGYLLSDSSFLANKVFAKHDEKYMPPELGDRL